MFNDWCLLVLVWAWFSGNLRKCPSSSARLLFIEIYYTQDLFLFFTEERWLRMVERWNCFWLMFFDFLRVLGYYSLISKKFRENNDMSQLASNKVAFHRAPLPFNLKEKESIDRWVWIHWIMIWCDPFRYFCGLGTNSKDSNETTFMIYFVSVPCSGDHVSLLSFFQRFIN